MSKPSRAEGSPSDEVSFEVRLNNRRVRCVVSEEALGAVSGTALPLTSVTRRGAFDRFRVLIDAAAKLKMAMPETAGLPTITLTPGDLRRVVPTHDSPPFGSTPRSTSRPPTPAGDAH